MTAIGFLSVAPVMEGSMAGEVAKAVAAIDEYGVEYQTTPMGTIIETEEIGDLFGAAQAAHEAVDGDRVETFLKIDHKRSVTQTADDKVDAVEAHLDHEARSDR